MYSIDSLLWGSSGPVRTMRRFQKGVTDVMMIARIRSVVLFNDESFVDKGLLIVRALLK
jgi:hypothetical protein